MWLLEALERFADLTWLTVKKKEKNTDGGDSMNAFGFQAEYVLHMDGL